MGLLVYRSFEGRSTEPSVGKVIRDGEKMYRLARRVIVIDKTGTVVENFNNDLDHLFLNCIAILGPVEYKGKTVPKAVVMEIGLKRFVPYTYAELRVGNIPPRASVARLSDKTELNLLPTISAAIQEEVDAIILSWEKTKPYISVARSKNMNGKRVDHSYELNQRVFVKVPKEEYILSVSMLLREREWRASKRKHYDVAADSAKDKLRDFISLVGSRSTASVPDEKIKGSRICSMIANDFIMKIKHKGYRRHAIDEILARIGSEGSLERVLLERIFEVFKVPTAPVEEVLVFKPPTQHQGTELLEKLGELISYRSIRHTHRRKVHASNCIVFTVLGSPASQNVINARLMSRTKAATNQDDTEDDDIPF